MQVKELAQIASAQVQGSEELELSSIAADPAQALADQLAMVFPPRFAKAQRMLKGTQAKVFLVSCDLAADKDFQALVEEQHYTLLIVPRPKYALKDLITHFEKSRHQTASGVHPSAVIEDSAQIDSSARIGALVYVGANSVIGAGTELQPRSVVMDNVVIGKNCVIKSGAVIEDYSVLGDRVVVHPNAVIGADGYSYSTEEPSNLEKMQRKDFSFNLDRQVQHKINSAGNVIIGDDVEIGAGTCIDRGTIGPTEIGMGTKIDNNCQIAHNVKIGKDVLVIAQTGIAGSAKIGDRVVLAGHSGVGDGVEIGNDAVVGAFSAVNSDIDQFMPVLGVPAIAYGEFMRRQKALGRICKAQEELRRLKTKVEDLTKN